MNALLDRDSDCSKMDVNVAAIHQEDDEVNGSIYMLTTDAILEAKCNLKSVEENEPVIDDKCIAQLRETFTREKFVGNVNAVRLKKQVESIVACLFTAPVQVTITQQQSQTSERRATESSMKKNMKSMMTSIFGASKPSVSSVETADSEDGGHTDDLKMKITTRMQQLEKELQDCTKNRNMFSKQNEKNAKNYDALSTKNAQLEKMNAELRADHASFKSMSDETESIFQNYQKEIDRRQQKLNEATQQIEAYDQQQQKLINAKINEIKGQVMQREDEHKEKARAVIEELREAQMDLRAVKNELEKERHLTNVLQSTVESLRNKSSGGDGKASVEDESKYSSELSERLNLMEKEKDGLAKENGVLLKEKNMLAKEVVSTRTTLKAENSRLSRDLDQLRLDLSNSKKESSRMMSSGRMTNDDSVMRGLVAEIIDRQQKLSSEITIMEQMVIEKAEHASSAGKRFSEAKIGCPYRRKGHCKARFD